MKRENIKFIFGIVIGVLISGITVFAVNISSANVEYDNTNSGLEATTVEGAINELYQDASKKMAINTFGTALYNESMGNLEPRTASLNLNKGKYIIAYEWGHASNYANNVSTTRLESLNLDCDSCNIIPLSGKYYETHPSNKASNAGYITTSTHLDIFYVDVLEDNTSISAIGGWGSYNDYPCHVELQAVPINE